VDPAPASAQDVTRLLRRWSEGDTSALDALTPIVYQHLRRIAAAVMRRERDGHTLQPTALIGEAYLRLLGGARPEWKDRVHFFAIAARLMRQILVHHARHRNARKRGGGEWPILVTQELAGPERPPDVVALDEALVALARFDARKAQAIELHYFGGLSQEEIATVLGVHVNTVGRELRLGRAWLEQQLASSG